LQLLMILQNWTVIPQALASRMKAVLSKDTLMT
jgi:hypothetical protein